MASILLQDRNLLFLHVPKTGGASLSHALRQRADARPYPVVAMADAVPCVTQLAAQLPRPLASWRLVAFVRNPWDWTVSGYLHVSQRYPAWSKPPSFRDFVLGPREAPEVAHYPTKFATPRAYVDYHTALSPWQHLGLGHDVVPAEGIGHFEALADDAYRLLGIRELPHLNRAERLPYASYYDDDTRQAVAERHHQLIERFGYRF